MFVARNFNVHKWFQRKTSGQLRFLGSPDNLLERRIENELVPACQRYGLALFTWSPMAMGMLAGRYAPGGAPAPDSRAARRGGIYAERGIERGIAVDQQFVALARAHGHDPAQLA